MYVLIGLLVLLVVLLALPFEFEFDARWPETDGNRACVSWAFGAVRFQLGGNGEKRERPAPADRQPETSTTAATKRSDQPISIMRAFKLPKFRRRLWRFACDLWGAVHKRDLQLSCRVGLEDPADTGLIWAVLGPVSGMLRNVPDCDVALTPDFNVPSLELAGLGALRVYPIRIVGLVVSLLASPSLWRGVSAMRSPR